MDGTSATPVPAATAIQAKIPGLVPKTPAPPLSPLPALPTISAKSEQTTAREELTTACPRQAQWALFILLMGTTLLLAAHSLRSLVFAPRLSELQTGGPLTYRLDLNQASHTELMQLPGIGPKLAQAILENRDQFGPFQKVEDLTRVPGIKNAMFKRVEKWICVNNPGEENNPEPEPKKQMHVTRVDPQERPKHQANLKKEAARDAEPLDLNTASAEQLDKLPRIGPVLAKRIIEERNLGPFESVDDLNRVKGIGPKILAGLRPYVTVEK